MKSPIAEPVAVGAERSSAAASSTAAQHATDLPPAAILPSFTSLHFLPTPASSPTRGSLPTDRYRSRADLAPDGGGCGRAGEGGARRGMWGGWKRGGEIWGGGECGLKACAAGRGSGRVLVSPPLFLPRRQPAHDRHSSAPQRAASFRASLGAGGVISGTFLAARGSRCGHLNLRRTFTGMPLW